MPDDSLINVAFKSASYNIVLQVLIRVISSLSNALLLRFITKDALGVINVRLILLYSTCHCFSREAFRRSCISKFDANRPEKTFNLLWLSFPTCIICSLILRFIWLNLLENPNSNVVPYYSLGVDAVLISVLIEIFAEPLFVFSQSFHFIKLKVLIEGISLTLKSIVMLVLLSKWPNWVIHIFCISQILSSFIYALSYYIYFWWYLNIKKSPTYLPIGRLKYVFPRFSKYFVDWNEFYLTWSFFKQTLLKQLLTEGERYVMTFCNVISFSEQGLYDVVNNLGSLAVRFIFLPIEESGYVLFSHLVIRGQPVVTQKNAALCLTVLVNLLKAMVLIGLIIWTFGYTYSRLLLQLYGGSLLSSEIAVTLLRWHCFYVLFLAINGVTECFKSAAMSQHEIDRYNKMMVVLSLIFLFASYCLVKIMGGKGFILANALNMGLRIIHSIHFMQNYFKIQKLWLLRNVIPHNIVLLTLSISICFTYISEGYFCCDKGFFFGICHFLIGLLCFVILLIVIWCYEKSLIQFIQEQWRKQSNSLHQKPL